MAWLPGETPTGFVAHWGSPGWQEQVGFACDSRLSSGGHWTAWVLVEVHTKALAATFMELIANNLSHLLISKADSSQGE